MTNKLLIISVAKLTIEMGSEALRKHIVEVISAKTQKEIEQRARFEVLLQGSTDDKVLTWQKYINFEMTQQKPARVKLLYETALLSPSLDTRIWTDYAYFLSKEMRDVGSARVVFERCRQHYSKEQGRLGDLIAVSLENAIFEEEQQQIQKARKLYEVLTQETAPGDLKSLLAFVSFEIRMSNNERAKDLYFKAFEKSISKSDTRAVTLISVKYARFLAFKCNDVHRACEIMDRAITSVKSSKVLYLSQLNLMKHLEGLG